jgi:hypothetical protein
MKAETNSSRNIRFPVIHVTTTITTNVIYMYEYRKQWIKTLKEREV